jgi:hypothetical protein
MEPRQEVDTPIGKAKLSAEEFAAFSRIAAPRRAGDPAGAKASLEEIAASGTGDSRKVVQGWLDGITNDEATRRQALESVPPPTFLDGEVRLPDLPPERIRLLASLDNDQKKIAEDVEAAQFHWYDPSTYIDTKEDDTRAGARRGS